MTLSRSKRFRHYDTLTASSEATLNPLDCNALFYPFTFNEIPQVLIVFQTSNITEPPFLNLLILQTEELKCKTTFFFLSSFFFPLFPL
jgi:hypothetical protein